MEIRADTYIREIMRIFQKYPDIFPHIRQDYIQDKIKQSEIIYDDGVVLTFLRYKRKVRIGGVNVYPGDYGIKQIVNSNEGNGKAKKVLTNFIKNVSNSNIYLTVRSDNEKAIGFYKRFGFEIVSDISWKHGRIQGKVMKLRGGIGSAF